MNWHQSPSSQSETELIIRDLMANRDPLDELYAASSVTLKDTSLRRPAMLGETRSAIHGNSRMLLEKQDLEFQQQSSSFVVNCKHVAWRQEDRCS